MMIADSLTASDIKLAQSRLQGFLPWEIYDIHVHPHHPDHFAPGTWQMLKGLVSQGCHEHQTALQRYMSVPLIHGLYFGMPHKTADRPALNSWIAEVVATQGTPLSRALMLVSPSDNPELVAEELRSARFCGLKVYHCYANQADTMSASIEEFAPEWMWEILHEVRGVLLLHIVRPRAIADPANQASLRRLCRAYPHTRLILAHVARSFNYRHAREGLHAIADLDNAVVDTSAICETEAMQVALNILGPKRVLWGSDFPVSELRGRCIATGDGFHWLYPEPHADPLKSNALMNLTLVGIESLLSLREACEDVGLTQGDVHDIFLHNALRTLAPHLPPGAANRA
jgi:glutamate-1-semialdehyde 2,1-aminomutase